MGLSISPIMWRGLIHNQNCIFYMLFHFSFSRNLQISWERTDRSSLNLYSFSFVLKNGVMSTKHFSGLVHRFLYVWADISCNFENMATKTAFLFERLSWFVCTFISSFSNPLISLGLCRLSKSIISKLSWCMDQQNSTITLIIEVL